MDDYALAEYRRILGGTYRFEAFLGRGGSASVYRVTNLRLNRREALKILHDRRGEDFVDRFEQEAQVSAQLHHPSIVTVFAFGHEQGLFWYAMQLVDGPSLRRQVRVRGSLTSRQAAFLGDRMAGALEYSHRKGVVHRDVKPANIILDQEGEPVLTDFGIAKSTQSLVQTQTGLVLGTPAFISPEQAAGRPADGRSDVYSLGITLYQAMAEAYPFDSDNDLQQVILRMSQDPIPLRQRAPDVHPALEQVIMTSIAREPDDRYPSAGEMQLAFRATGLVGSSSGLGPNLVSVEPEAIVILTDEATEETTTRVSGSPHLKSTLYAVLALAMSGALLTVGVLLWDGRTAGSPGQDSTGIGEAAVAAAVESDAEGVSGVHEGSRDEEPRAPTAVESSSAASPKEALAGAAPAHTPRISAGERGGRERSPQEAMTPTPTTVVTQRRRAVELPQIDSRVEPVVPVEHAGRCAGQRVVVSILVSELGVSESERVLSGDDAVCRAAALDAARKFTFLPALDSDQLPVEAWITVGIEFGGNQS